MELHEIDFLLERYYQGETTLEQERQLEQYFCSNEVAERHIKHAGLFRYYANARGEASRQPVNMKPPGSRNKWLRIAAAIIVTGGTLTYAFLNENKQDLGTHDDPEIALAETQRALEMLSGNLNKGVESVAYVTKYEQTKRIVFPR